jgi:hypothetical protein
MQVSAFCLVLWIAKTLRPRVAWSDPWNTSRARGGLLVEFYTFGQWRLTSASQAGALRAYRLGSLVRISGEDLAAFLAAHREP